ncbi:hypothetical protein CBR_g39994 [Chara braunii]|uniref:Uncharacterized protein n=1 Tax=Chara braunii TaxID=69332 RepID=A0A388LSW7_CHABU|nr:hypothetical protein CBR_g39994 [Chara braunii]|eukprot:GBG85351.1 hypothetical protein CBR_g39994 [Chara braunii]
MERAIVKEMKKALRQVLSTITPGEAARGRKTPRILPGPPKLCRSKSSLSVLDNDESFPVSPATDCGAVLPVSSSNVRGKAGAHAPVRIAIDLGTSSCSVAVCRNGTVQVIPDALGKLSTPSAVAFTDKKRLVGVQAQSQQLRTPENLLFEVKRLIGRDYESITEEERRWWPFIVVKGNSGEPMVEVKSRFLSLLQSNCGDQIRVEQQRRMCGTESEVGGWPTRAGGTPSPVGHEMTSSMGSDVGLHGGAGSSSTDAVSTTTYLAPEQILAMLLAKMKCDAEAFLQCEDLHAAVITVPALYCDRQRMATKVAAEIAGFRDVQLVSESTAAAVSYAHHTGLMSLGSCGVSSAEEPRSASKMLVFSLGGGNVEVALVTIAGGVLTVNSTVGNPILGGMDFDHKMMDLIRRRVQKQFHRPSALKGRTLWELKTATEKAKKDLTLLKDAQVELEFLSGDGNVVIRRQEFEKECKDLLKQCMECVTDVLRKTHTWITEVNALVLVGGSTRIPKVVDMFRKLSDFSLELKSHPFQDEAVVRGAALFAAGCSERVVEIHPVRIAYYDYRRGKYMPWGQLSRPLTLTLPQDGQMELNLYEIRKRGEQPIRTATIQMAEIGKGEVSHHALFRFTIDRCGILGLDEGGTASVAARLYKYGQPSTDQIRYWKQLAVELTVYERRIGEKSSERNQWTKYIFEVEKRESSCPPWLGSIIYQWKCDIERWLAEEGAGIQGRTQQLTNFETMFADFKTGCRHAFGELWARSLSGRRFIVVDRWEASDVDECLQNLRANKSPQLCDVVVSMSFKELCKAKKPIEEIEGIELATRGFSSDDNDASPDAVKAIGIPYVVLSAGPVSPSDDRALRCKEWNRIVGQQVAIAAQAGLRVLLRLGQDGSGNQQSSDRTFGLEEEEKRVCEAQLKDIVPPIGRDWRNIEIVYAPPQHVSSPQTGALLDIDIVSMIRHIRGLMRDLVNSEAADSTRVLVGGCSTVGMWDDLIKCEEIQGLVFEGGFQDRLLVQKLCAPTWERRRKVLLCREKSGHSPILDKRKIEQLQNVIKDLMAGDEVITVVLITVNSVKNAKTENPSGLRATETDSVDLVWRDGAYQQVENLRSKVTVISLCSGYHGEELEQAIEDHLSRSRGKLKRPDFAEGEVVVVEYRPKLGVMEIPPPSLALAMEAALGRIRRRIMMNISPHVAQAVRIVCSLDGLATDTHMRREITKQPNVDGVSLRLEEPGNGTGEGAGNTTSRSGHRKYKISGNGGSHDNRR